MTGPRLIVALALAGVLPVSSSASALDEELKTIPTRPGVTTSFLLARPADLPVASVILFAGGHGGLALSERGIGWGGKNFLVRNRGRFAEHGLLVAVIDAPSDRRDHALWNFRTSADHAQDVIHRARMPARRLLRTGTWGSTRRWSRPSPTGSRASSSRNRAVLYSPGRRGERGRACTTP